MGVERWVMARVVVESGEMLRCSRPPWVGILSIGCSPAAAMLKAGPGSGGRRGRAAAAVSVGEASGGRWRRWVSGVTVMEEEVAAAVAAAAAAAAAVVVVVAAAAVVMMATHDCTYFRRRRRSLGAVRAFVASGCFRRSEELGRVGGCHGILGLALGVSTGHLFLGASFTLLLVSTMAHVRRPVLP